MRNTTADAVTKRIVTEIYPIIREVIQGSEASVVQSRIRVAVETAMTAMENELQTDMQNQMTKISQTKDGRLAAACAQEQAAADRRVAAEREHCNDVREQDAQVAASARIAAVTSARNEERATCTAQRQQDAQTAAAAQTAAVNTARGQEQAACTAQRQSDAQAAVTAQTTAVANARAQEQAACTALRQQDAAAAATAQAAAVAAAKASERAKCVQEIETAPVTGITIALTLFASSMRTQIRNYVATGPH